MAWQILAGVTNEDGGGIFSVSNLTLVGDYHRLATWPTISVVA